MYLPIPEVPRVIAKVQPNPPEPIMAISSSALLHLSPEVVFVVKIFALCHTWFSLFNFLQIPMLYGAPTLHFCL
jgi:hypothetical protein